MRPIAYYVSGHGFGHATRSAAVIARLCAAGRTVHLVTDVPRDLFDGADGSKRVHHPRAVDVGLAQRDALESDPEGTVPRLAAYLGALDARAKEEADMLRELGAGAVAGDIPPLAFAAAKEAGLPAALVGNFTWDWIYAPFGGAIFAEARARFGALYRSAAVHLRLPFAAPPLDGLPTIDVPLVVRPQRRSREETRRALGLDGDPRPLVLLSFGGFAFSSLASITADRRLRFLAFGPTAGTAAGAEQENLRLIPNDAVYHPDLIAAVDAVISKPGYGIVSEVIAYRRPCLMVRRSDFAEAPILLEGLARHVPTAVIDAGALGDGAAIGARLLELIGSAPLPPIDRLDGAEVVAQEILRLAD